MAIRSALYRCYWKLERILAPGLRSSQYAYFEELKRATASHPVWLDLGCGHQVFGAWMDREQAEVLGQARLAIGLDSDVPSLRHQTAIRCLLAGDVTHLPFPDATFDLVSANMVVEHLADPAAALAEIQRVLTPGGSFVFHTPNYRSPWVRASSLLPEWAKHRLARLLESRPSADVFPTRYRMNTAEAISRQARDSGFAAPQIRFECTSAGTGALGPLAVFELCWIRLLMRPALAPLRTNLVVVLSKPAET